MVPGGGSRFILKGDKTPTSIGGEWQQISLGGSPISFQDKASGGLQRCADVLCHAKHDAHLLLFTLLTVTHFVMHRNCILCSFAPAALGILAHSARKHLAEQWHVNSNKYKQIKADASFSVI